MTQDGLSAAPRRFTVGGVVNAALPVFRRNFWHFFAIAVVVGLPLFVLSFVFAATYAMPASGGRLGMGQEETGAKILSVLLVFVAIVTYFVIQSAISFGTLMDLRGQRAGVRQCISRGVAFLPRLLVNSLVLLLVIFVAAVVAMMFVIAWLMSLGNATTEGDAYWISLMVGLGLGALVVFLLCLWWVFVTAMVAENLGPIASFGRSRRLTKGHRWGILGILIVVILANFLCSLVIGELLLAGAVATATLLNVVVALIFTVLSAVLSAVGYYALRAEKENFGLADLARVFD